MFRRENEGVHLQRCLHLHFLPIVTACKVSSLLQSFLGCSIANGSTEEAALKPERVRSHHTSSPASPATGVLSWGPERLCPTSLNPADPRQSSEKCSTRKKKRMFFSQDHNHTPVVVTKCVRQGNSDRVYICSGNATIRSKLMSFGSEGAIHISWKCGQQTKTDK